MNLGPTLDLDAAAARSWDVIVVGAGPAGAVAARTLAQRGAAVLLVDRATFPRYKVCGCCLNRRALRALEAAGLGDVPSHLGAISLHRVRLAAGHWQADTFLSGGVALSRTALDTALAAAAVTAGAAFLPATRASLGPARIGGRTLRLVRGVGRIEVAARVVLAADGLGGRLLAGESNPMPQTGSRMGAGVVADIAPATYEPGVIFMACAAPGYVGLVRLEDGRLDVAAAFNPTCIRAAGSLGLAAASVLREVGLPPVPDLEHLPWRGTPLLTRQVPRPATERVFTLGDAAGYVEPFTGEGIAWALAAATAVVPVTLQACRHWTPALASRWSACFRHAVGRRQRVCRAITHLLRRPLLTRAVVATLGRAPALAAPVIHYLHS